MRYYLTTRPSIEVDPGVYGWGIPAGARCIDVVPASGIPLGLGETSGVVLAWTEGMLADGELLAEGDIETIDATLRMRQAWRSLTGGGALPQGATLADLLWWHWTDGADPDGGAAPVPLVADSRRRCRIMLPGGRMLRSRAWRDSTPAHRARVISVLRRALHESREDALAGRYVKPGLGVDLEGHRHQLGYYARIYDDVPIAQLRPASWRADETPLPPRTTLADTFDRSPSTGLGTASGGWSWTSVTGSWNVTAGGLASGGTLSGSVALELAAADLDGDNHYAAIEHDGVSGSPTHGVITRYNGAASITGIHGRHATTGNTWQLYQFSGGTATLLDSSVGNLSAGNSLSLASDGSTHTLVRDGSTTFATGTSSVGAGNRRTGLRTFNATANYRAFEAADLGAAEILLAANPSSTGTAVAALSTEIGFAATVSGEGSAAAALATEIALASAADANASAAASLATEITLSAAVTGAGTAASALGTEIVLAGATTAAGTVVAALEGGGALLSSALTGAGTAAGALTTEVVLGASSAASGTAAAVLATEITLSAATSATGTAAAALTTETGSLAATVEANGTTSAQLSTEIIFSGATTAQASASAALETEITLVGAADVVATLAAELTTEIVFRATTTGAANVAAELTAGVGLGTIIAPRAVSVTAARGFASLTPDRAVRALQ